MDRKRILEILFYGCLISVYSVLLDDIGSFFVLWIYEAQLVPITARLNPIDLTIMPVTYMIVYQFLKKWRHFLVVQAILALGASFLSEPLFTWMHIYKTINWEFYYSFPIYLALGIMNKWLVERLSKLQKELPSDSN